MMKKIILIVLMFLVNWSAVKAQKIYQKTDTQAQEKWVDSVFNALTPEERLGQLFMVAAYSNRDEKHYQEIDKLIAEYNIGGLIFFQGGAYRQARLNNRYQSKAKVP